MRLLFRFNITKGKEDVPKLKNNTDILYPIYDSDMVDNIGHRSRVLMSLKENNTDDMQEAKYKENMKRNNISGPLVYKKVYKYIYWFN